MPQLHEPSSVDQALELLGSGCRVRAAGCGHVLPREDSADVIRLEKIPEMHGLYRDDGGNLHLAPLLSLRVLRDSPLVRSYFPALALALSELSPIALEHGTLGGLLHANEPDSPLQPALMTIHTNLFLASRSGTRLVPLGLWIQADPTHGRRDDEILVEVVIPTLPKDSYLGFYCLRTGNELSRPCLVLAASMFLDRRSSEIARCRMAKIVLGGIAPGLVWAEATESILTGRTLEEDNLREAAAALVQACPDDFEHGLSYRHRVAILEGALIRIGQRVRDGEEPMIGIPVDPSWPTAWRDRT